MVAPICLLCGKNPATYVCQSCGRAICGDCFDTARWSCSNCVADPTPPSSQRAVPVSTIGAWLLSIAFAMIAIGTLLIAVGSIGGSNGSFSGGAVIFIGPIPIILGTGPNSVAVIALAAMLTVIAVGFYLSFRRRVQH